ncbi:hypothetical protein KP509_1Z073400 [Ceratopteris richardii]|nr:hypothetical protein KP509_1Z073400 [Ceratopteris richardii]
MADADDFEIPSLKLEKADLEKEEKNRTKKITVQKDKSESGPIYLGPHGAPPSHLKQQESTAGGKKTKRKQKLKDSEKKSASFGRENKVDILRDLMGSKGQIQAAHNGSPSEWLDPHCHESQFERLA